ncbi:MAG: C4-type zinc ribbon domain-containing protein [Verrucomicrobiota bacterium]
MQDIIEKLLVVQDRDRKLIRVRQELSIIPIERRQLIENAVKGQAGLEAAKHQVMQLESDRKRLELEAESKKQQMDKYSVQQFQTRKNDEFRAIGNEIETAKRAIFEIENQILENMEQSEAAQKEVVAAQQVAAAAKKLADEKVSNLDAREKNLQQELASVEADRRKLAEGVDAATLNRYERMLKNKGENVVVNIEHGACGGCHMRLSRQTVVSCRGGQEIIQCNNCGRILYYLPGMDVDVAE